MSDKNDPVIRFDRSFLKPRYLGTWLILIVLWLMMWLPRTWIMRIGAFLGDQIRKHNSKRNEIAKVNIRLCFPNISQIQRQEMVAESFRNYGRGLVDMGLIMMSSKKRVAKYCDVVGMENITEQPETQSIILITYHTTTLDMCAISMLTDIKLVSMMKRDKNPVLNWFLYRSRMRFKSAEAVMRDQGLRRIVTGMREGKLCYLVPDEDFGVGKHTVFAPFFGQPRSTLNIVSRLAKRTGAIVLPSICRLIPETGRYITTVSKPLENFPTKDSIDDATTMNQAMERLILDAPDQYLWTFRWFKTQPDGAPSPYQNPAQAQDPD